MVLFTLVAGFLPFEDPNTSALYKKILSGSYEIPRWLSDGKRIAFLASSLSLSSHQRTKQGVEPSSFHSISWVLY